MVTMTAHGGNCCGARHLRGFGPTENNSPNTINAAAAQVDRFRMTEVILNGNQVRDNPNVLQRLADLGFVLVSHYINGNHMSHNYVFHRCDRRLPLRDGINWPGQVITPLLQGDLPEIPRTQPAPRPAPPVDERRYDQVIRTGDRVRVNSAASRRNGHEFTVRSRTWDDRLIMIDGDGMEFSIVRQNLVKIIPARPPAPPAIAPVPVAPVPAMRHEQPDAAALMADANIAFLAEPTVMISFYHNVYANGRSDIAWSTIEAARAARGNPRRIDRHDLLTNGEFLWVEGVNL